MIDAMPLLLGMRGKKGQKEWARVRVWRGGRREGEKENKGLIRVLLEQRRETKRRPVAAAEERALSFLSLFFRLLRVLIM